MAPQRRTHEHQRQANEKRFPCRRLLPSPLLPPLINVPLPLMVVAEFHFLCELPPRSLTCDWSTGERVCLDVGISPTFSTTDGHLVLVRGVCPWRDRCYSVASPRFLANRHNSLKQQSVQSNPTQPLSSLVKPVCDQCRADETIFPLK